MAPTNTTRPATEHTDEHVDPDDLICPGCTEQVRCAPYLEPLQGGPSCS